jgi:catalase
MNTRKEPAMATTPESFVDALNSAFRLPDGSDTDLVTHSYDGFPAKNPEEFQQFFLAVAGSKPGVPSPTPIEAFQETHPAAKMFLTTRDPPPVSYATTTYFGVNSFKFVNEKGAVTIGRYQLLPDAGRHFLSKDESAKAATNYLEDEIRQRVARGAVRFKVVLQLAAPGDAHANAGCAAMLPTLALSSHLRARCQSWPYGSWQRVPGSQA